MPKHSTVSSRSRNKSPNGQSPPPSPIIPADGAEAGFEAARNHYVAGVADRLTYSRSYVPLICSYWNYTISDQAKLINMVRKMGGSLEAATRQVSSFLQRAAALGSKLEAGVKPGRHLDPVKAYAALEEAYRSSMPSASPSAARARSSVLRQSGTVPVQEAPGGLAFGVVPPRAEGTSRIVDPRLFGGFQGMLVSASGQAIGIKEGLTQYINVGWLGILFYDRLRFRPSGMVAGEQIYSLSLAPGEEVTLSQQSETKRSKSFEEVMDQTAEQELEFNSTWTTDVSQQDTDSQTSTVGGNLGLNVGVNVDGVNLGLNGGVSASDSNTIAQNSQVRRSQQVTERLTTRLKQEHKTTFKVSTDITEQFGSKRVLRNANPARGLVLNMHKMYEKQHVLLERWEAKLCVSLYVDDPGRDLRADLRSELDKMDPQKVPLGTCAAIPGAGSVDETKTLANGNPGGDGWGWGFFSTMLPAGTVLSSYDFEVTNWIVDPGNGQPQYSADVSQFADKGGRVLFNSPADVPIPGSSGGESSLLGAYLPNSGGWFPTWWTVSIDVKFTWQFVADPSAIDKINQCLKDAKDKIKASFSAARVNEILAEVESGRREAIYKRIFEDVLLPTYYQQRIDPPVTLLERMRDSFDWNEGTIEYLPWWMTEDGRQNREDLRTSLLALPGNLDVDIIVNDILVSSGARVYLPIKPGHEADAVLLMTQLMNGPKVDLTPCIQDFLDWKSQNLGPITYPLPDYNAVMAVGPFLATPTGATAWKNDWEKPRRKFLVLDEWAELIPTDGIHVEPTLTTGSSADSFRTSALVSDLKGAQAMQDLEEAQATLERTVATDHDENGVTLVIGDPAARRP